MIGSQPRLPRAEFHIWRPNFRGSPVFMHTPFNAERLNNIIQYGDTYGKGYFFQEVSHALYCICTNTSRALSATAEFLVLSYIHKTPKFL